ncbi:hypothetical protein CALCODRAFT_488210 [Calocera cornea HHB12733]|uniref:Uncharacterized protein n=1 Tax=Calocera cornea HHB12733 TaxID=1353952 RepID=A0A165CMY5_9BASI|nr:hypothetical protein CALCODRAFT_488210 [Calocera cornea HHB12733]
MMIVNSATLSKADSAPVQLSRSTSQRTQPPAYEDTFDQPLKIHVLPPIEDLLESGDVVLASEPVKEEKAGSPVESVGKSFTDAPLDNMPLPATAATPTILAGIFERMKLHHAQKRARCTAKHAACEERWRARKLEREARRAEWAEWEKARGCCWKGKDRAAGWGSRPPDVEAGQPLVREGRRKGGCCS